MLKVLREKHKKDSQHFKNENIKTPGFKLMHGCAWVAASIIGGLDEWENSPEWSQIIFHAGNTERNSI
jgi:hypothetical protein